MREDAFDAVIVDMRMPDLSGEQLFQELKARDESYAERVIFTTRQLVDDSVRSFLASTGRPCVPKPFEFVAFDQVLPARRASYLDRPVRPAVAARCDSPSAGRCSDRPARDATGKQTPHT